MKTKIFSMLMAGMLMSLTMITGCSNAAADPAESAETPSQGEAPAEKVKLEFINQKQEAVQTFTEIVKAFEKEYPDIEVELNSPSESITVLTTRASSGTLPDLFTDWPSQAYYKEFANNGYIEKLSSYDFMKNIDSAILEQCKLPDGEVYTMPVSLNTYGVFYSKQIFEDLKLTVPTTYDEFLKLCDTIKAAGTTPILFPDKDTWTVDQFFAFNSGVWCPDFMTVYGDVLEGKSHLQDNAGVKQTAQRTLDLRLNYGQPDTLGTAYSDAINDFANGKSAMFIQGIWATSPIQSANPDFDFSMFAIPADKAEDTRVMAGVDCAIDVSATSPNKEAALKFLEFVAQPSTAQIYSEKDHSPSAIKDGTVDLGAISPVVDYVTEGKTFPQLLNIQTVAIAAEEPNLCQSLIMNKNVDDFVAQLDALWYGAK